MTASVSVQSSELFHVGQHQGHGDASKNESRKEHHTHGKNHCCSTAFVSRLMSALWLQPIHVLHRGTVAIINHWEKNEKNEKEEEEEEEKKKIVQAPHHMYRMLQTGVG